jgi:hypothetical protein
VINYKNVASAIDFYKNRGYTYIEVPWLVLQEAINVTLPENHYSLSTKYGELIGSAEQSFIQLLIDKKIHAGKYVAATPCFRDDEIDEFHSRHFFKVELFECYKGIEFICGSTSSVPQDALDFFKSLPGGEKSYFKVTKDGVDIEINNVEIGSYGRRQFNGWHWTYGTGYADPRFSVVTKLLDIFKI